MVTVGVLGPLVVSVDGRPVELTTGRLRTVLAVLAMSAGRPVSADRLAVALWGEEPPGKARRGVQTYLARLRGVLGATAIRTEPAGYLLDTDPDRVDALRFTGLLGEAARASDPAVERDRLVEALGLWRGTPFDGLQSEWLERTEAPRLTERYLAAIERRIDLDLAAGRSAEVVAQLRELTGQHPLRESLWVRLLVALDRGGRPAEALEQYQTIRVRLADELGADPGPELQRAYTDLLAGRPAEPHPPAAPARLVTPRQLPADVDGFTGRAAALKALDGLLGRADTVVISAIAGTAGVGKTALAVHWAHRVAGQFPDGQIYADLRGFSPTGQVMTPAEAVRGFLHALEVPPQRVPPDLDSQIGLYRSLLAGRRMLILLDNARDADQVRPLLPGTAGCLVIVTSRHQLPGLLATEAARPLVLDLLTRDEARRLLARRLGADRVTAEPAAADEIITSCARLPLALAIAAARAATRPDFPLATVAAQLREAQSLLDSLDAGDPATDVRAAFSCSYHALSPQAGRLFRLLALHPGPDVTEPAVASLAGLPMPQVRRPLAELCRAHLLTEAVPGRYSSHDLLRAYATELAETYDSEVDRRAARHRLLDHYLHTAYAAAMRLVPHRDPIELPVAQPGVRPEPLADHGRATGWFTAERSVLLAAIRQAHHIGFDQHAWQLAWSVVSHLDRRGEWDDLAAVLHIAVAAAGRLDDRVGLAFSHRNAAVPAARQSRYEDAQVHLERALDLFQELGDTTNQASTRLGLAQVAGRLDRNAEALHHTRSALELYREAGNRSGEADALNGVGWYDAQLGDYRSALVHSEQALVLHRELGDRRGEAGTLDTIGFAHHRLGNHQQAVAYHQQALDLYEELGESYYAADTLVHLADALLAAGDGSAAQEALRRALTLLERLDHPDAGQVRRKLQLAAFS